LSRYEYASALDKEQKSLLSKLINNPSEALTTKNKDSIIVIFENVRKGILSGSISVKDVEKSTSHLTETEEWLGGFIKKINEFAEQKKEIEHQLSDFDNNELTILQKDLEKKLNLIRETELKISSLKKEIDEDHTNLPKMVSEIEKKLRRFSNTDYTIIQPT
jgi:chromosome segregation ATPase